MKIPQTGTESRTRGSGELRSGTASDTPQDPAGIVTHNIRQMLIEELDLAEQSIDRETSSTLLAARKQALVRYRPTTPFFPLNTHQITAFASFAAVAVVVALLNGSLVDPSRGLSITGSTETLESVPILSSPDGLEFYQSVDFLVWMEKNNG